MLMFNFIAGLGILLLAMKQLEAALASLGASQLKLVLEKFTRTPLQGIVLGALTTAILQSSSIVGLMTMAFVGAGVLPFRNGIGVILGSNLGTTFTGWLVTWLGFKVDLAEFYVLLIGCGALLNLAARQNHKLAESGQAVFAFGLLLFGLTLMKDSIGFVVDLVDVSKLQDYPALVYFIFGALLTALIQSSSATMMITLSAMSAGILQLESAAALIIGADLGTTSTVILGSLSGKTSKRQIALTHLLFNLITDLLAILCLPLLLQLITDVYQLNDPLYSLVAIHSSFNLFGILLFYPAIDLLQRRIEQWVPAPGRRSLLIEQVTTDVPEVAFTAVEQDVRKLLASSILLNAWRLEVLPERRASDSSLLSDTPHSTYAELKSFENLLSDYLLELQRQSLQPAQLQRVHQLLVCIRDTLYSTKAIKDIDADMQEFHRLGKGVSTLLEMLLNTAETVFSRSLDLLATNDTDRISVSAFKEMLDAVRSTHTECNAYIYHLIDGQGLQREQASSALNINRELLLSELSLINALEHMLLPGEQARTVSELLNLHN